VIIEPNSFSYIASEYVAPFQKVIVFKESKLSLTGDSGTIKDIDGNVVFHVKAKKLTLSQRRHLVDAHGNTLGQLRLKKTPSLHNACYIGSLDDEKKFKVKVKGLMNIMKCDADIYIGNDVIGKAYGNWRAKSFTIELEGNMAASITRKTNFSSLFLDADSYVIAVKEGVDIAFISLVVIALDELYHDDN